MLIIDGDYPVAFGALELNRDLTLPVDEIRRTTADRFAQEGYPDSDTILDARTAWGVRLI